MEDTGGLNLDDLKLDVSWLNDLQKEDISGETKEPMTDIQISFVYVNVNNEIHKIISEKQELEWDEEENVSFLSKDDILGLVSSKIKLENSHYKLVDAILFFIHLDVSELDTLSPSSTFIKKVSLLDDIVIEPSLSIFHSTNSMFFLLQEIPYLKKPSLQITDNVVEFKPDEICSRKTRKRRNVHTYTRKLR